MNKSRLFTKEEHDRPPKFTGVQRKRHLYIDKAFTDSILSSTRSIQNKVYIALAYRYFCYTNQFFDDAFSADLKFIANQLGAKQVPKWEDYKWDSKKRHRHIILEFMGVKSFDTPEAQEIVERENHNFALSQRSFKSCFHNLVTKLRQKYIEIPNFKTIDQTIRQAYADHENTLLCCIDRELSINAKDKLNSLYEQKADGDAQKYKLTLLKRFSQKLKPTEISKNVEAFNILHDLFSHVEPAFNAMNLNIEGLKHYANNVQRAQILQISKLAINKRHLQLVAFTAHQYFTLQDIFVETLIQSVTNAFNAADKKAKEHYYSIRHAQTKHTHDLVLSAKELQKALGDIEFILKNDSMTNEEKVVQALASLKTTLSQKENLKEVVDQVESDLDSMSGEALFYHFLDEGSLKLQQRCNKLVESLQFDIHSINRPLLQAIEKFKEKSGRVDASFPVDFMSAKERKYVDTKDKFKVSLYKVILFHHIMQAIKGDVLSIKYSYKYQSLEDYLINKYEFEKDIQGYLNQAEIPDAQDPTGILDKLELTIHAQYQETNTHLLNNENEYLKTDGLGGFKLAAYRRQTADMVELEEAKIDLFPEDERVSLCEVLSTVNRVTGFLSEFVHRSNVHVKQRPEDRALVAGLIGKGCHFSQHQFSKISKQIKNSTLVTAQNNYLTSESCNQACNAIMQYVEKMALTSIYLVDNEIHTSSDGMKYTVPKDSLNARNSFRYGGREPVVSAYAFSDSRNLFPHVEVISGSEREAHYMIDGVLKNEVVKSDMHVTDTHGYTEMVFGAAHLLNISFAPRIKNVHRSKIYSFKGKKAYSSKSFPVLPDGRIRRPLIEKEWKQILRVIVSIKLGYTTASQIFKRLNSYTEDNNPLYVALKEYGRIIKSLHILRYIDNLELRQAIHKQLNKGESGNKLDRALAIGHTGLSLATREEQEEVENCKRVIKNAIVCWNYMYLTQRLIDAPSDAERRAILEKIGASSTVSWEHIVIHGEFDFSDNSLQDTHHFSYEKMHDPNVIK